MKKDAYYFSHDANAQDDPKCVMLIEQLGMEGYGIFWALIERLRAEKEYKLPFVILPALARRWNSSQEKINVVVKNFGLFELEDENFFSLRLLRSMQDFNNRRRILSDMGRIGGLKSAEVRHAQATLKPPSSSKVNEIKEKESKGKYLDFVTLTPKEYDSLLSEYGEIQTKEMIQRLNDYIGSKGNKYKSHYHTIKNWFRRDGGMSNLSKGGSEKLRILANVNAMIEKRKESL